MKNKIIYLWAFFAFAVISVQAQTLSPVVISAGGGYTTSATGSLSYTVAEMTMVETFVKGSSILTQGFQQPELLAVSIPEQEIAQSDILLYPNPTNGQISLSYQSATTTQNSVKIYNILGAVLLSETYYASKGLNTLAFDLSRYNQGIYFLELTTEQQGKQITSVHKINLAY